MTTTESGAPETAHRLRLPAFAEELVMLPAVLLLTVVFGLLGAPQFSLTNLSNVLVQNSSTAIIAVGLTIIILAGGLDLSVGAAAAASGVLAVAVMQATGSGVVGFAAAIGIGILAGAAIGGLITVFDLVPFVVTLGTLYLINGVTLVLTHGDTLAPVPSDVLVAMLGNTLGVPTPLLILVAVFVLAHLALAHTGWGRKVVLIGANKRAALISGIAVKRIQFSTYVVAGACSGLAGALLAARIGGATASTGTTVLFTAIGAVVIGGTSLFGGRGSVIRTAIGVLFLGLLTNGMQILGMASYDQKAATGAVILLAVALDVLVLSRKPN